MLKEEVGKKFPRNELVKKLITATHTRRRKEIEACEEHTTVILSRHTFLKCAKWVIHTVSYQHF